MIALYKIWKKYSSIKMSKHRFKNEIFQFNKLHISQFTISKGRFMMSY